MQATTVVTGLKRQPIFRNKQDYVRSWAIENKGLDNWKFNQ